jgi:sugar phosphate isomerase/epimerase
VSVHISIVTDEISADPESAIELGVGWGVHDFELRGYYTDRAPMLSAYQRSHLRAVLDDFGARVVAVSPGLFKFPLPSASPPRASLGWMDRAGFEAWDAARGMVRQHLEELLPAACDYANELGAGLVVAFSFARPPEDARGSIPPEVVDTFARASERVAESGLGLVIETEAGFFGDDGPHTAALVRAVGHSALGVNWDPGNVHAARAEAYPAGYAAVRGLVRHVHFKDVRWAGGPTPDYVVQGEIDWPGQIKALADDGYDGYISIEPHMQPKIASAHASLERLRSLIAAAESQVQAEEARR